MALLKKIVFIFVDGMLKDRKERFVSRLLRALVILLLSPIYIYIRNYWNRGKFRLPFFVDIHVLACPEHNLIIVGKCLSGCM